MLILGMAWLCGVGVSSGVIRIDGVVTSGGNGLSTNACERTGVEWELGQ